MLARENRIKKKKDFERVLKKGKGFKEDFLVLKFISNNLRQSRFGIIISRKISKKAVIRNKIKRRLKALFRFKLAKTKRGIDIVLVVLPGCESKNFWEMERTINKLFRKAKIS